MVSDQLIQNPCLADALKIRRQAGDLLQRLEMHKQESEQRLAESGRRDPLKSVTGHTALENAIASARQMLRQLDQILMQMDGDPAADPVQISPASPLSGRNGQPGLRRPGVRLGTALAGRTAGRALGVMAAP